MDKPNTTDFKFWAGGVREFHDRNKKSETGDTGFFEYLSRLFRFLTDNEIDQRLFIQKDKKKSGGS